jgi:hypothetical protein
VKNEGSPLVAQTSGRQSLKNSSEAVANELEVNEVACTIARSSSLLCSAHAAASIAACPAIARYQKLHADPFDRRAVAAQSDTTTATTHKSAVSEASPNFFRTHATLKLRPTDYSRKIPLADAFHKVRVRVSQGVCCVCVCACRVCACVCVCAR